MIYRHLKSPQMEYRLQERQRVEESVKLADKFPHLKLMVVDLDYSCPDEILKNRRLKYVVNLATARSVFLFGCPHAECSRGDFDLTLQLAEVIARREKTFTGEICCPGWLNPKTHGRTRCPNRLLYKFKLGYSTAV